MENALNLQDIQEKKRLSELFAKHANEAVHKISDANGWKEGSTEKAILHAVVGGITAKLGGDHFAAGASSGAVNEVVNGVIAEYGDKITPDMHQWLSAMVGVIVNNAIGQTLQTGAAEAVYGTKWNYHAFQILDGRKLLKEKLGIEDKRELNRIVAILSQELPGSNDGIEFLGKSEWSVIESVLIREGYAPAKVSNFKDAYIALAEKASSQGIRVTFLDPVEVSAKRYNPYDELYVQSARKAMDGLINAKIVSKDEYGHYKFPGNSDVIIVNGGKSWGLGGVELVQVIDRFGNVYVAGGINAGASLKTGTIRFGKVFRYSGGIIDNGDIQEVLLGGAGGFSAIGGIGGSISFGKKGSMVSIHAGMTAGVAFDFTWTALKGRI